MRIHLSRQESGDKGKPRVIRTLADWFHTEPGELVEVPDPALREIMDGSADKRHEDKREMLVAVLKGRKPKVKPEAPSTDREWYSLAEEIQQVGREALNKRIDFWLAQEIACSLYDTAFERLVGGEVVECRRPRSLKVLAGEVKRCAGARSDKSDPPGR
jgi:hypothetical protein